MALQLLLFSAVSVLAVMVALAAMLYPRWPVGATLRIRVAGIDLPYDVDTAALTWFSKTEFEQALTEIHQRVHRARQRRRFGSLEPWVTTDVLTRWTQAPPLPPELSPDSTLRATVVEARRQAGYDHVTVRLERPQLLPATNPHHATEAAEEAERRLAAEYWTLERATPGAAPGTCPRCGAPLVLDRRGRCRSCRATLDVGRPAWVLSRLESGHEWWSRVIDPDLPETLPELDAITADDPTFDPDVFVARVATLYPHLARAAREPTCPLALVAISPLLRRELATALGSSDPLAPRRVVDSVVVKTATIMAASHVSGYGDGITVDITAEAAEHVVDASARYPDRSAPRRTVHDRWTFWRPAGVTSTAHGGALAQLCPVCGAPIQLDADGQCRHCNTAVTLGTRDWSLLAAWSTIERLRASR